MEDLHMKDKNPAPVAEKTKAIGLKIAGTEAWNWMIADQVIGALPCSFDSKRREAQYQAIFNALTSMEPRDAFEGMMAANALVANNAAMDCHRRAADPAVSL